MESILLEVAAEFDIFTLKLSLHIRDKNPRDDGPSHCKCGTNKENTLDTLFVIMKGVLDRCKYLRADSGTSLAYSGGKTEEVTTDGSRERFGTTQKSCDLETVRRRI